MAHVNGTLARSRAVLLDVLISVDWELEQIRTISVVAAEHSLYLQIFCSVMANSRRIHALSMTTGPANGEWKKSMNDYGNSSIVEKILGLLRCPTPQLVSLSVRCEHTDYMDHDKFFLGYPAQQFPLVLPDAPKLQRVHALDAPIICRRPHPGLPALRSLTIECATMFDALVWDTLAAAPCLDALSLQYESIRSPNDRCPAAVPITSLSLRSDVHISTRDIALPNLQFMELPWWRMSGMHITESMARTVSKICVYNAYVREPELGVYRELAALEHVILHGDVGGAEDDTDFFAALCDPEDLMWPNLRHLEFWSMEGEAVERDGMLRLVRARNLLVAEERQQGTPRPLEKVEFDSTSVPGWVTVQVKEIMGDKCRYEI